MCIDVLILFCFLFAFGMHKYLNPDHPHHEDDEVEEHLEDIIMRKMETIGPRYQHQQHTTDADDVGPFDDDETSRDVPCFVLPGAWKDEHQEDPVQPLLETGAFGSNADPRPTAFVVRSGDDATHAVGGQIEIEDMFQNPAGLTINHFHRPKRELVNGFFNGPVVQRLPTEI